MNANLTGEVVKRLRQEAEYTQQDLADRLGVTSTTVSRWECGQSIPHVKQKLIRRIFGYRPPTPIVE